MKTGKDIWSAIKDRFQDFEEAPPEKGWENISSRINNKRNKNYKVAGLFLALILAAFLIGYFAGFLPQFSTTSNQKDITASNTISSDTNGSSYSPFELNYDNKQGGKRNEITDSIGSPKKEQTPRSKLKTNKNAGSLQHKDMKQNKNDKPTEHERLIGFGKGNKINTGKAGNGKRKSKLFSNPKLQDHNKELETNSPIKERIKGRSLIKNTSEDDETYSEEQIISLFRKPAMKLSTRSKTQILENKVQLPEKEENELISTPKKSEKESVKVDHDSVKRKFHFQVFFSPRYSYRRIASNVKDEVYIEDISSGINFKQRFGWEAGFFAGKNLTDRLSLDVGLSFISLNEAITYTYTKGVVDSLSIVTKNNNHTVVPVYEHDTATASSNYYYTGITISASYSFWQVNSKRFYFILGTGINLLVKGKTIVALNGIKNSTLYFPSPENPLEQMNFKVNIGLGYAHKLSEHIALSIEPVVNYYLGSTFKEREPVGIKPYTLGVNVGLRF